MAFTTVGAGRPGYSTFAGGADFDQALAIAVDGAGSVYVTGRTFNPDFPTTPGAFETEYQGGGDAFVMKLDPAGSSIEFSTFIGGSGWDSGYDIDVDQMGNVVLAGDTESSDFPTSPGAYDESFNGAFDAFVLKLRPNGSELVFSTYIGGTATEGANSLAVDGSGNAYVTGYSPLDYPTTPGAYDETFNGSGDAVLTKVRADGAELAYSTYLGSTNIDFGLSVAVDDRGAAYVTGYTYSDTFPTSPEAYDTSFNGNIDAFVTKVNRRGSNLVYSTFLGGADEERAYGVVVGDEHRAFVTGLTLSADFPTTPGAFDVTYGGFGDAFVLALDHRGADLRFSTYLGAELGDQPSSLYAGDRGSVAVAGLTDSTGFPTTSGAFDRSHNGLSDAFIARLSSDGSVLRYGSFLGGIELDYGWGVAVRDGAMYVSGETYSNDFPASPGSFDPTFNGYADVFVTRLPGPSG